MANPEKFKKTKFELDVFSKIDKTWTLFLDRDGVINKKLENDYVKDIHELQLLPNAIKAIVILSQFFGKIIVATNQQGIGKKLMTHHNLKQIHRYILQLVKIKGGNIDAFYYAPQLATENSNYRKPQTGMAIQAKNDFNEIDFSKSIMVGDSLTDIEFALNANMIPVFLNHNTSSNHHNYTTPSLYAFAKMLNSILKPN